MSLFESPEEREFVIRDLGYDPSRVDITDDYQIVPKRQSTPPASAGTGVMTIPKLSLGAETPVQNTPLQTFGKTFAHEAPSAIAGGLGAAGVLSALGGAASLTGAGALIGIPLMLAGGYGASRLARAGQEAIEPESWRLGAEQAAADNPTAALLGNVATIPLSGFRPGRSVLDAAKAVPKLLTGLERTPAETAGLLNTAINAGLQPVTDIAIDSAEGRPMPSPEELLRSAAIGAVFSTPNAIGRKLGFPAAEVPRRLDVGPSDLATATEIAAQRETLAQALAAEEAKKRSITIKPQTIIENPATTGNALRGKRGKEKFVPQKSAAESAIHMEQILRETPEQQATLEKLNNPDIATEWTAQDEANLDIIKQRAFGKPRSEVSPRSVNPEGGGFYYQPDSQLRQSWPKETYEKALQLKRELAADLMHHTNSRGGNMSRVEAFSFIDGLYLHPERVEQFKRVFNDTDAGLFFSKYEAYKNITDTENSIARANQNLRNQNTQYNQSETTLKQAADIEQQLRDRGLSTTPKASLFQKFKDWGAEFAGIKLEEDGNVVHQDTGKPVAGALIVKEGSKELLAKLNPNKAGLDTLSHEMLGHGYMRRLKESPRASDREFAAKFEKLVESDPEYQRVKAESGDPAYDPEEFIASQQGLEFIQDRILGRGETEARAFWRDLMSHIKTRFTSGATMEDFRRIYNYRGINQPRVKVSGKVGVGAGVQKNSEESQLESYMKSVGEQYEEDLSFILNDAGFAIMQARKDGVTPNNEFVEMTLRDHPNALIKVLGEKGKELVAEYNALQAANKKYLALRDLDNPSIVRRNQPDSQLPSDDFTRYNDLQAQIKQMIESGDIDGPELQRVWAESEQIKNRNKGMPPVQGQLLDDKQVRAASGFAKMREAAAGDERRVVEADRELRRDAERYSEESQLNEDATPLLPEDKHAWERLLKAAKEASDDGSKGSYVAYDIQKDLNKLGIKISAELAYDSAARTKEGQELLRRTLGEEKANYYIAKAMLAEKDINFAKNVEYLKYDLDNLTDQRNQPDSQISPENERLLRLRKKGEGKTPYPFTEKERRAGEKVYSDVLSESDEAFRSDIEKGVSVEDSIDTNPKVRQGITLAEVDFPSVTERNQPNPQIETPEFKKWFGDSKVVDSEGKPTILYHGTTSDFNSIDLSKLDSNALYGPGFYMTDNKNIAAGDTGYSYKGLLKDKHRVRYMELLPNESLAEARKRYYKDELDVYRETNPETVNEQKDWMDSLTYVLSKDKKALEVFEGVEGKANVMPLFAKIDKPFNMEMDVHESDLRAIASALEKQGDSEHLTEAYQNLNEKTYDNILWADLYQEYKQLASEYGEKVYAKEAFTDALKSLGYDGITHKGGQIRGHGIPHKVWIAFDPVKVKSAIGNRGTFDPKNPDIRYNAESQISKSITPKQDELLKNFYKAANQVAQRTEYGTREGVVNFTAYKAIWSNAAARWDISRGVGRLTKGTPVKLDANEILVRANSLKDAQLIADNLPELPLYAKSTENNPLFSEEPMQLNEAVQALQDFWDLPPKSVDVVKSTEAFMDKLRSPEQTRYSTETLLGKPFRPLRAEIDKVEQDFGPNGKTVAGDFDKGFRGFYEHKDALTGQLNGEGIVNQYLNKLNPMEWFVTRTNPDIEKAGEILLAKSYGKTAPAPTPKQQEIINTIRDNLLKSVALKNAEPTLKKTIPDPNYYPQVPKDTVLNTLLNKVGTPEYARLVKDFIDYHRSIGTPDPNKKLQEFLGGYEKQEVSLASSFGPVDKSAGVGIPPSWAESSPTKVMPRFNNRYARRIAYERAINKHKDVLDALEEIKRADTVKNVLYDIQGKTEYNEAWRNAAGGVIRAGMLGPLTGAKDFVSNLTLGLQHTNPLDLAAGTVSALSNFKENWKRSFETGVNRHNFGTLEIGDGGIDAVSSVLRRVRDTLNSVQGRNILELVNRTIAFGQGNFLAQAALDAGKKGRLSGIQNKFLQDFAPDWRKATITPEYVSSVAARYARSVQGSYDYRGLPALTQKGSLAPVLSLARWNVEKFNNFRKYVVDPAYEGNLTPLLMSTIGMFIGGTAVQKLVEEVTGKKEKTAKWEEIRSTWNDPDATTKDAIAYKLAAIASLSGYAGVMGDLVKSGMDVMHKNMPTGYGNPLLEGLANAGRLTNELAEALREGNFDVTANLMSQIAEDYLQSYRLAINKLSPEKQDRQEQTNRNRDLRAWKQLTGQDVSEYSGKRVNPFTDQDSREFKRTSDISRAAELLPELITSAIAKSKGDPEKLKSELSKLKRNSYQTLPSPEKTPMTFLKYIQYLTESQGEEKASEALLDYFTQVGLNQAKSEMIPSL